MGTNHGGGGGVNFGRRLPPIGGQYSTPINSQGLLAFVVYCYRFSPAANKVKEILDSGQIGRPLHPRGEMATYLPHWHPHEDYRDFYIAKAELGGGTLLDQSHILDLTNMFLGTPSTVFGISRQISDLDLETDDFGEIVVRTENNTTASLHISLYAWPRRETYQVTGTGGSVMWSLDANTVTFSPIDGTEETFPFGADHEARNIMYVNEVRAFLAAVNGSEVAPSSEPTGGLASGILVMRMIEAVRKSAGTRTITLA